PTPPPAGTAAPCACSPPPRRRPSASRCCSPERRAWPPPGASPRAAPRCWRASSSCPRTPRAATLARVEHLLGLHDQAHERLEHALGALPDERSPEGVGLMIELTMD